MRNLVKTCLLIYTFIFFNTTRWCSCKAGNSPNNSALRCKPSERAALLNFNHNLTFFDKDVSSSWEGEECCKWTGVVCDNTTGHILELHLNGDDTNHVLKMEKLEYLLELKQLQSLDLSRNNFSYRPVPRFMGFMKQLRHLNLNSASLGGSIPNGLGNLTNLLVLDLSNNKLSGEIPAFLGNLSSLKKLYLSTNNLTSNTSSLTFPSNLEYLDLSSNLLSGKILTSIGKLSKLKTLDITSNSLNGRVLSEPHFANLSSLTVLDMSDTMLTLNLSSAWVPPFQLLTFDADSCKINGQLPPWLQTQKNLSGLILSDANISGIMPSWFHTFQQLGFVDLSNNHLSGFPIFPSTFTIDLSNNLFSGPLLEGVGHIMPNLETVILSNNKISGLIPNSFCQLMWLEFLDIQNNSLSGEIPNCFANISSLTLVSLSYNKLKGNIPCFNTSYSFNNEFYLHLNDNMLSGEIPSCLSDITNLKVLDIGENHLSGKMIKWFSSVKFKELKILRLRKNKFSGTIPRQLCSLPQLQTLDLAHNRFSGSIPRCLSNLRAMTSLTNIDTSDQDLDTSGVSEVIQGIERAYTSTLPYLVDIDLSCNNLVGSIPNDVTKMSSLLSLNLSHNQLSGTIPNNIGGLRSLISLDLSKNKLRGSIPTSMGELYCLSHLDLSYNNLSGPIPTGNQLQTLSDQASIYAGNPDLCGDFLLKKCKSKVDEQDKGRSNKGKGDNKEKLEKMGLDLVVMSGFATGFWGVVGSLALNTRWRHAVFQRLEDGYNWLYVILVLKARVVKARINRR
ncbi:uncharacterized protein LOC141608824 [Silene latifolia]|uniref:uncharacterized protein LOC141608824 n=1 Tax=Silene latifolia TaxID=37657 RepID=UPI003D784389